MGQKLSLYINLSQVCHRMTQGSLWWRSNRSHRQLSQPNGNVFFVGFFHKCRPNSVNPLRCSLRQPHTATPQTTTPAISTSESPPPWHWVNIYWKAVFNESQCFIQVCVPLWPLHVALIKILNQCFTFYYQVTSVEKCFFSVCCLTKGETTGTAEICF